MIWEICLEDFTPKPYLPMGKIVIFIADFGWLCLEHFTPKPYLPMGKIVIFIGDFGWLCLEHFTPKPYLCAGYDSKPFWWVETSTLSNFHDSRRQFIATCSRRLVTPKGTLVKEFYPKWPKHSGPLKHQGPLLSSWRLREHRWHGHWYIAAPQQWIERRGDILHGWSTYPRLTYPPPEIRPYLIKGLLTINKPLIRPYFWGRYVTGGRLTSHEYLKMLLHVTSQEGQQPEIQEPPEIVAFPLRMWLVRRTRNTTSNHKCCWPLRIKQPSSQMHWVHRIFDASIFHSPPYLGSMLVLFWCHL